MEQKSQTNADEIVNNYTGDDKESSPREIVLALADEDDEVFLGFFKELKAIKAATDEGRDFAEGIKRARDLAKAIKDREVRHKKIIYLLLHPEAFPVGKNKAEVFEMLNSDDFLPEALNSDNPEMGSR